MSHSLFSRRTVLAVGSSALLGLLAGCSDDDSKATVETNIEDTVGHLEDAEPKLEAIGSSVGDED